MNRKTFFAGILIFAVMVLYGYRLDFPATPYFDEVYHVKTAREYIALNGNTDTVHPPLAKWLVSLFIRLLGDTSWVWRLLSYITSIGSLVVFFFLSRKLFKENATALLATLLLTFDGIFITQARITMHNGVMLFCMLLSIWYLVKGFETKDREQDRSFCLSGIFFGLAGACRWIGFWGLPVMDLLWIQFQGRVKKDRNFIPKIVAFFVLAPAVAYLAGHLILPFIKGYNWGSLFTTQKTIWSYHKELKATHPYGSDWWTWPLMIRPIWYYVENQNGLMRGIFCIGNPAVMWAFIPASGYLLWRLCQQRCRVTAFILLGFLSQWLPWAVIGRVKFFHYIYTAMPFLCLAVALYVRDLWKSGVFGKTASVVYFILVLGMFAYWYPLYTGYPVMEGFFKSHMWFKSWI